MQQEILKNFYFAKSKDYELIMLVLNLV